MCFQYTNHHQHWGSKIKGDIEDIELAGRGCVIRAFMKHQTCLLSQMRQAGLKYLSGCKYRKIMEDHGRDFNISCAVYFLSTCPDATSAKRVGLSRSRQACHAVSSKTCFHMPVLLVWHLHTFTFYANKDLETIASKTEGSPQKRHTAYNEQRAWHHHQWDPKWMGDQVSHRAWTTSQHQPPSRYTPEGFTRVNTQHGFCWLIFQPNLAHPSMPQGNCEMGDAVLSSYFCMFYNLTNLVVMVHGLFFWAFWVLDSAISAQKLPTTHVWCQIPWHKSR